jgi:hypothetical protein
LQYVEKKEFKHKKPCKLLLETKASVNEPLDMQEARNRLARHAQIKLKMAPIRRGKKTRKKKL